MKVMIAILFLVSLPANAQSTFVSCLKTSMQNQAVDPLREKIVLAGPASETPFSMLTDPTKPNDAEKEAIAKWAELYTGCVKNDETWRRTIPADAAAIMEATASVTISQAAGLYAGDLTYSQFNKERLERIGKVNSALALIGQRERGRAQADDQNRQNAALQYLLNQRQAPATYQQPQPYQVPINPSVTTNCYRFGPQVTCTSR